MFISVFDLFKIGIGPSSSHTVGPMCAARSFVDSLNEDLSRVHRVVAEMYGSLGATGRGHGTPKAVLMGLEGEYPETVDIEHVMDRLADIRTKGRLCLLGRRDVDFCERTDLLLHKRKSLPYHPNGMIFAAFDADGEVIAKRAYYSVGGGFVIDETQVDAPVIRQEGRPDVPYHFESGKQLLALCEEHRLSISQLMLCNEVMLRAEDEVRAQLLNIWRVMRECIEAGCRNRGVLPGGLEVKRRAPDLYQQLLQDKRSAAEDHLLPLDWLNLYAISVNEENAAGGRVVTAPTNGAAGIIPAVLNYYVEFVEGAGEDGIVNFLLTSGAIGSLYKRNASISGADVGCQGEVGSACSMAAAGLAEVMGASPPQVENAAEIAMEHNLGLTCDPIGGLVQIPCIERNAVASTKAVTAVRIALRGDGTHFVSLDKVIKTMLATGKDMSSKYKETARGGLASNVLEIPINFVDC